MSTTSHHHNSRAASCSLQSTAAARGLPRHRTSTYAGGKPATHLRCSAAMASSPRGHRRASVRLHHAAALLLLALSYCFSHAAARADPSSSGSGDDDRNPKVKKVPAVIVFGDSTVDTGNNNVIRTPLKSDFPPYGRDMAGGAHATGRFCNGRLPPDFISEALGLPPLVPAYLDPAYGIQDFAKGVCFASAGTGLDNKTAGVLSVIPLWKEVEYFKEYKRRLRRHVGGAKARTIVSDALYVVSIGTNDFLENYFLLVTGRFAEFTVAEFEDFLVAQAEWFLGEIHALGARRVTFAGLSTIGCLPLERTLNTLRGGCVEEYNQVARDYNAKLLTMLRRLMAARPGLKVAYVDVYKNMLDLITNPSTLGLENVEEGCCATGKVEMSYLCNDKSPDTCQDADKYFFWDSFHPTQKVNQFFAKKTLDLCYQELL